MKHTKALLTLIILLNTSLIFAQQDNDDQSWILWENNFGRRWLNYHLEKDDALKMMAKWDEIDVSKSSNKFAGTYLKYGWMSGYFLRWSPEKGFVYVNYFDVEHPCYFSYGKVSVKDSDITFIVDFETRNLCPSTVPKETARVWVPAYGGKYLIPKVEAKDFGEFYGGFGYFNTLHRQFKEDAPFASRRGKIKVSNQNFILPKDLEKFVKQPINGKIISVAKSKKINSEGGILLFPESYFSESYSSTNVRINLGKNQNVTKGLEFILMESEGFDAQTLKVTKVGKNTSEGVVLRTVNEKGIEIYKEFDYEKNEMIEKRFETLKPETRITTSLLVAESSFQDK